MANSSRTADLLEHEFLPVRAKLLEVGAALDRLDRAGGQPDNDPRLTDICSAIQILLRSTPDRAEQIQMLFSREYDDAWQEKFATSDDLLDRG